MAGIGVGDKAPSFKLASQDGSTISLESILSKGPAVVFFYPKDYTSGCTAEACSFRDNYDAFQEAHASVIGISSDSVASHRKWADKHGFPFILLSDEGGATRKSWGVPKSLGIIPGRVTYVLDKTGVVRHVFNSQLNPTQHIQEALGILKTLS